MDGGDRDVFERSLRHAVETHSGGPLDAALLELGWTDALPAHTHEAVSILFELEGSLHASSSALDHVLACSLGLDVPPTAGYVLPPLGRRSPPGAVDGAHLAVRGLGTAGLLARETTVVVARAVNTEVAFLVPAADLVLRPVRGMDPELGLVEVSGTVAKDALRPEVVAPSWPAAVALAQLALGHQLVGAARTMLELARRHALERVQFGQPISGFQAVRHRLAETLVAIESAEAVLGAAWEDGSPTTAAVAKALAGRGARTAARHCQQVLAGIGFTTEHEFHHYARRALVLDELFGSSRSLTRELGTELLATRRLPDFALL
jgi:alkylation response protein AidB-like acyl-CoA dehydrogenase